MRPFPSRPWTTLVAPTVLGVVAVLAATPASAQAAGPAEPAAADLPGQQVSGMMPAGSPDAATFGPGMSAASVPAATTTVYAQGIDVSSYQHPGGAAISWAAAAASGLSFTVVKATESTNYTNPYLLTDVAGARGAGLVVGVYHFARPELSPTAQADYFARQVNGIGGTLLPPVLDLESNGGLSSPALVGWTSTFLTRLRQDTGPYFWSTSMGGSAAFTQYPLWEAHYTTATAPQAITGWPTWRVWQYSNGSFGSPAPVPGVPARVDRDRFAGTKAQLVALASTSRPGIQPPFTGTATASQFPDSTFVVVAGDTHVYEIVGLAPMWVTSWSNVGGRRPVRTISSGVFHTLRSSPLEGTFLIDGIDGHAYRVAGGAPVLVTSWVPFGGVQHYVRVDGWDIAHAGACSGYCHLAATVRDSTVVRSVETGQVYVVAGAAPIYVSTWATFGGLQPFVNVNQAAIDRAGSGTLWNHLAFTPAEGTVISDGGTGQLYRVTGGHPQPADPSSIGAAPFTLVDHAAILNAGGAGVWAHLS